MPLPKCISLAACLASTCWLAPAGAQGEVYKWVDENGHVNYSEKKDAAGKQVQALKISVTLSATAPPPMAASGATAVAPTAAMPAGRLVSLGGATLVYRQAPKLRGAMASAR